MLPLICIIFTLFYQYSLASLRVRTYIQRQSIYFITLKIRKCRDFCIRPCSYSFFCGPIDQPLWIFSFLGIQFKLALHTRTFFCNNFMFMQDLDCICLQIWNLIKIYGFCKDWGEYASTTKFYFEIIGAKHFCKKSWNYGFNIDWILALLNMRIRLLDYAEFNFF